MRHYAKTEDDRQFLVELECDGCGKRTKPGSADLLENWMGCGTYTLASPVDDVRRDYCGECWPGVSENWPNSDKPLF